MKSEKKKKSDISINLIVDSFIYFLHVRGKFLVYIYIVGCVLTTDMQTPPQKISPQKSGYEWCGVL